MTLLIEIAVAIVSGAMLTVFAELIARRVLASARFYVWPRFLRRENHLMPGVFPGFGPTSCISINSDGERGEEAPAENASVLRVLIAGGSAAEGYFLDQSDTLEARLQRELNRRFRLSDQCPGSAFVSNVGRSGFSSDKMLHLLHRVMPQHRRLDVVVMIVGASDILNWLKHRSPEELSFSEVNHKTCFEFYPGKQYQFWPWRSAALTDIWRYWRPRFLRRPEVCEGVGKHMVLLRQRRRDAKTILQSVASPEQVLQKFSRNVEEAIDLCHKVGARVLFVPQPHMDLDRVGDEQRLLIWNAAVGDPHKTNPLEYYSTSVLFRLMDEINAVAVQTARRCGASSVVVQPLMEPPALCFFDEFHFTPFGAAIVAKALAETILEVLCSRGTQSDSDEVENNTLTRPSTKIDHSITL